MRKETISIEYSDIDGQVCYGSILKNFNFLPMIRLYRKLELFGGREKLYNDLEKLSYFRNRIHIKNYHKNFEKDEKITFSERRIQYILSMMEWILDYFAKEYSRPWSE